MCSESESETCAPAAPHDVEPRPLGAGESFTFACAPGIGCFNECCRDLNQFLTPYDALRLAGGLGLTPKVFLARFTRRHAGPGSGLPVVTLVPGDPQRRTCPFVTAAGCQVYPDRPSSCRSYPLMRLARRCRATGAVSADHLLLHEPHCLGFGECRSQTARQWEAAQGLEEYLAENDRLLEVISLKNRLAPGPLPPDLFESLYTALYALDEFRDRLSSGRLPGLDALEPENLAAAQNDDLARLRLGLEWVKGLFRKTVGG